jgi:hypothetical protein
MNCPDKEDKAMRILLLAITASTFIGCSTDSRDEARTETVGAEIANDYNTQMQKAQNVELQLQDQKAAIDAAIEESDRGTRQP